VNVVPDTSVVVDGRVSERVADGRYEGVTVYVPEAVVGELEAQANAGHDPGWKGLEELQRLAEHADAGEISVEYVGSRPSGTEIDGAGEGDIDAAIRDIADDHDATLLTSDGVQAEVARAKGIDVDYLEPVVDTETAEPEEDSLAIEEFFTDNTMSLHLRSGTQPKAKRGDIGEMRYEQIADEPTSDEQMEEWAADVIETARASSDGFIELSEEGMDIVQYRDYRIAVARPPFADAIEITAVRPVAKTTLEDYAMADNLKDRFTERQRGVLISGSPGAGKSTFAQAVA